jgi:hypothetical protein
MAGIFTDTINAVSATITALGLVPVTDPRNARPLVVFIELPTFTSFNNQTADITVDLRVLGAPPGNQDTTDYILGIVDTLMNSALQSSLVGPPSPRSAHKTFPAYDLTIRIGTSRT